jgi:CHAD domain-containing protein
VARERIEARLERFLERGRALAGKASRRRIHKERIQAKKLRYLVDAFGAVLDKEASSEVVRRLKKLQDALGEYNDRQVEIELLERFGAEMTASGTAPAATLLAMGRRQAGLKRGAKRLRRRFRRRFERFAEQAPLEPLLARGEESR